MEQLCDERQVASEDFNESLFFYLYKNTAIVCIYQSFDENLQKKKIVNGMKFYFLELYSLISSCYLLFTWCLMQPQAEESAVAAKKLWLALHRTHLVTAQPVCCGEYRQDNDFFFFIKTDDYVSEKKIRNKLFVKFI